MWDLLYLINIFCVWFSWKVANQCFEYGNTTAGWLNIFASSLNAVIVLDHFL